MEGRKSGTARIAAGILLAALCLLAALAGGCAGERVAPFRLHVVQTISAPDGKTTMDRIDCAVVRGVESELFSGDWTLSFTVKNFSGESVTIKTGRKMRPFINGELREEETDAFTLRKGESVGLGETDGKTTVSYALTLAEGEETGETRSAERSYQLTSPAILSGVRRTIHNTNRTSFTETELAMVLFLELKGGDVRDLSDLWYLPNLEELALKDTKVTDYAPLANHDSLRKLTISGGGNGEALAGFPALPGLRELTVTDNSFSDTGALAGMPGLERMEISVSPRRGGCDLSQLAGMKNLRSLTLTVYGDGEELAQVSAALSRLDRLETLQLTVSEWATPREYGFLGGMTSLKTLALQCESDGELATLPPLPGLKTLRINGAYGRLKNLQALAQQNTLEMLTLSDTGAVSITPLSQMENLHTLYLMDNDSIQNYDVLERLPKLKKLVVTGKNSKKSVEKLQSLLPGVELSTDPKDAE